jgi:hypothetical protein
LRISQAEFDAKRDGIQRMLAKREAEMLRLDAEQNAVIAEINEREEGASRAALAALNAQVK